MKNYTTPVGQIALRLERLSDAGLTHVSVTSESVVTARYEFSATNYYEFVLAPMTDSSRSFFWYEVEIDADGRLCQGEWGGLLELQATAEIIGFGADEWDDAVAALVGIQEAAGRNIAEAAATAAEEASYVAAELLNQLFAAPAETPPVPDEDEAMGAFKRAYELGPRRWEGIALGWDESFDDPPRVTFGKSSGDAGQEIYRLGSDPDAQFYNNGVWTYKKRIEDAGRQQPVTDGTDLHRALEALEDLQTIQRSAQAVMEARKELLRQELDVESIERRYAQLVAAEPAVPDHEWISERIHNACVELFEDLSDYLAELNSEPT